MQTSAASPPGAWRLAALVAGNVALAFGPWFVRLADTGPVSAALWRLALPLPLIALLAWREAARAGTGLPRRRDIVLVLTAGAFFALDLAAWHAGIERTRLGNAVLFGNSGSVVLMVWGLVAARRRPGGRELAGVAAALAGGALLLGRSLEISAATLIGDLLCLFAGLAYAAYLLPAQAARARVGPWGVLAVVSVGAVPLLLAAAALLGEPILPGAAGWWPLVLLALCSQVAGQGLLVSALGHFPPLVIGLALMTQPAIAAIIGWAAFDEVLSAPDIAGMVLVAAALLAARTAPPPAPLPAPAPSERSV